MLCTQAVAPPLSALAVAAHSALPSSGMASATRLRLSKWEEAEADACGIAPPSDRLVGHEIHGGLDFIVGQAGATATGGHHAFGACKAFNGVLVGASPSIRHHAMELVCSGNGGPAKWVAAEVTKDISTAEAMGMDCPLCLPSSVPPPHLTPFVSGMPAPLHLAIWRAEPLHPLLLRHRPPARAPPFFTEPT